MKDEHCDRQECHVFMKAYQHIEAEGTLQPFEPSRQEYLKSQYRNADKHKVLPDFIEQIPPVSRIDNDC